MAFSVFLHGASHGEETAPYECSPEFTPDVSGPWQGLVSGASITRNADSSLTITNESGYTSSGIYKEEGDTFIVADYWGELVGDVNADRNRIDWRNGSVWMRDGVHTSMLGDWTGDGNPCSIIGTDQNLVLVNDYGDQTPGHLDTYNRSVIAFTWNGLVGAINSSFTRISWGNGSVWSRDVAGSDITGSWMMEVGPCSIEDASESAITMFSNNGYSSNGVFREAGDTFIVAEYWGNLVGDVNAERNRIDWHNGTVWERQGTHASMLGDWSYEGSPCSIAGSDQNLILVNDYGSETPGHLDTYNRSVIAFDWGGLVGTVNNDFTRINWANGSVWTRSFANWSIDWGDGAAESVPVSQSAVHQYATAGAKLVSATLLLPDGRAAASSQRTIAIDDSVFQASFNFAPDGSAAVPGYFTDIGNRYELRSSGLTYGWVDANGAPASNSANTFERATESDQRLDTGTSTNGGGGSRAWEVLVPNGTYDVTLVAGDPSVTSGSYVYDVEDEAAFLSGGASTGASRWVTATGTVTVTDGRLTVSNGAGRIGLPAGIHRDH
ncbi:MAG: hypothetical protein QM760_21900 [Nibricoccus sp.]